MRPRPRCTPGPACRTMRMGRSAPPLAPQAAELALCPAASECGAEEPRLAIWRFGDPLLRTVPSPAARAQRRRRRSRLLRGRGFPHCLPRLRSATRRGRGEGRQPSLRVLRGASAHRSRCLTPYRCASSQRTQLSGGRFAGRKFRQRSSARATPPCCPEKRGHVPAGVVRLVPLRRERAQTPRNLEICPRVYHPRQHGRKRSKRRRRGVRGGARAVREPASPSPRRAVPRRTPTPPPSRPRLCPRYL
mmetsp:Transcript_29513/g.69065  ORF Transcript_29513/g.69065 Transcript_29513/m.69065 type:complete len:247 (+) Transcript_29513:556-1296(+)